MKTRNICLVTFLTIIFGISHGYSQNTSFGSGANPANGGNNNSTFGFNALNGVIGTNNSAFGFSALYSVNGHNNSGFGLRALNVVTGTLNSAFGKDAMMNANGAHNSAFGANALRSVNESYNSAFGSESLFSNNTGASNCSFGASAMWHNTTGSYNVALGRNALENNLSGSGNISIGFGALNILNSGLNNIAIGRHSANNLSSGNGNVFIGSVSAFSTEILNDRIIIATGGSGFPTEVNRNGIHRIYIDHNGFMGLGLGNNINILPQNRLEIAAGLSNTAGLRFRAINSNSPAQPSNGRVLTVNASGDVILTADQGSGGSTLIEDGLNTEVVGTGVDSNPYQINAENIYTHDGALSSNRIVTMDNNYMIFNTGGSTTTTGGRIYIGNTTAFTSGGAGTNFPVFDDPIPANIRDYRLYVEGGILTERIKVARRSTLNWADYVFADDYKLQSLKEVETFIKENKHLPGIESAQELVENGLDLGEMQAKQMGKIEELTLYIIEQDKKLEQQSKDIEELKALVKVLIEKK